MTTTKTLDGHLRVRLLTLAKPHSALDYIAPAVVDGSAGAAGAGGYNSAGLAQPAALVTTRDVRVIPTPPAAPAPPL